MGFALQLYVCLLLMLPEQTLKVKFQLPGSCTAESINHQALLWNLRHKHTKRKITLSSRMREQLVGFRIKILWTLSSRLYADSRRGFHRSKECWSTLIRAGLPRYSAAVTMDTVGRALWIDGLRSCQRMCHGLACLLNRHRWKFVADGVVHSNETSR